ncbi:hypothetical protein RCCS2_18266 [Roseobacter sp. CCS2]|nr:hypothetical protein RCCS2_18266 [Roseobacter sp. CCS2]
MMRFASPFALHFVVEACCFYASDQDRHLLRVSNMLGGFLRNIYESHISRVNDHCRMFAGQSRNSSAFEAPLNVHI